MQFYVGLEKTICDEIRAWSAHALELPNAFFGGLPPCPYARKAWADDRVLIIFKHEPSYQSLYRVISTFEDRYDLVILVETRYDPDPDRFHDYLDELNKAISDGFFIDRDIWLMGFHPEDEPNEFIDDGTFNPEIGTPYAMTFVQRLSKVQESADKLSEKGYYEAYLAEYDAADIFRRRENLYRRLRNGNEPS